MTPNLSTQPFSYRHGSGKKSTVSLPWKPFAVLCAPSRGEEASWELPRDQDCFDFVEANVLPQQLPHMLQGLHWFSMNQINQHYPRGLAHCFPLPLVLTAQQRHSSFCFSLQCIWGAGWYLDLISSGFLLFSEWSFIFLSFGSYFFLLFKSAWSHDRLLA